MFACSMDEEAEAKQENAVAKKNIECPDCSLETDLILVSSDGVMFAAHAQNLERYSEGFPPASFITPDESEIQVVYLDEKSATVGLLLQYVHLKPQPDIERIPFRELEELANAVEKYMIYGAMMVCKLSMKANASMYPMHVLRYAVKHGYKDLADQAAAYTIDRQSTSSEMMEFFGKDSQIFHIWVRVLYLPLSGLSQLINGSRVPKLAYRDQWMTALPLIYTRGIPAPTLHKGGLQECDLWEPFRDEVRCDVDCSPSQISRFEDIVARRIKSDLSSCDRCADRARRWGISVKARIGEVSAFSTFL